MSNKKNLNSAEEKIEPTEFRFNFKEDAGPSTHIDNLLSTLSIERMELITDDEYTTDEWLERKFRIDKISMVGTVFYIFNNLEELRVSLIKTISDYTKNEESTLSKIYELARSKFLIQEYFYKVSWDEPIFYNINKPYNLHFSKSSGKPPVPLPPINFTLSENAIAEINNHIKLRSDFLSLLYQFIDYKLEEIKMLDAENKLWLNGKENKEKELQLLEVWLALKEAGFLPPLSDIDLSRHRKQFFASFNLTDRDYKSRRSNYFKKKNKTEFLTSLSKIIEKAFVKKTNPPKK